MPSPLACGMLQSSQRRKIAILTPSSAPIFATIGFAVRIRNSGDKDVSWRQPEILLWGAGELASSNLIICFPEIGTLFRRSAWRRQTPRKPGRSTLEGWHEPKASKQAVSDPYMTKSLMSATFNDNDGDYIELKDAGNDVRITRAQGVDEPQHNHDRVVVKNEFKVERHQLV